jgi:hypothetical protein
MKDMQARYELETSQLVDAAVHRGAQAAFAPKAISRAPKPQPAQCLLDRITPMLMFVSLGT